MIKYKLLLLFNIMFFYGYAQKVIYSRVIYLNIPPKIDYIEKDAELSDSTEIEKETISFLKSFDSNNINEIQTKVNVEIDTIVKNDQKFKELELSFEPILYSSDKVSDFPSGEYVLNSSKISNYFTIIVKETLENKILNYVDEEDIIIINITGTADATSIKKIKYRNEFGPEIKQKYYYKGKENEITISRKKHITTNLQLAFLRTYGVRDYFEKNLSISDSCNVSFKHYVEIYQDTGTNFRTVSIDIIIQKLISH